MIRDTAQGILSAEQTPSCLQIPRATAYPLLPIATKGVATE